MTKYPLTASTWDNKELDALQNVIDSGMFSMGAKVQEFEEAYSKYIGRKYSVMVNSGSSANLLGIAALFYKKENPLVEHCEVIVPAIGWSTTYFPLQQYGLKLRFVDIDPLTLNYDLDALKRAINEDTRMIMLVHLLGNPNDMDKINEFIQGKNILLFEDSCEAMGAKYNKQFIGTFGILSSFSTFFSHHISTMEGGLITTDDEELYHILLSLRAHGWTRNLPEENLVTGRKETDFFKETWKFVLPGYNVRPLEMSGALGLEQLKKLPGFVSQRKENATYFKELFSNHPVLQIQTEIGESSWFGFSLVIHQESTIQREQILSRLKEYEIECRPIASGDFTQSPVMKYFNYSIPEPLKNAQRIHQSGLFVGNHHFDMKAQIDQLDAALQDL